MGEAIGTKKGRKNQMLTQSLLRLFIVLTEGGRNVWFSVAVIINVLNLAQSTHLLGQQRKR